MKAYDAVNFLKLNITESNQKQPGNSVYMTLSYGQVKMRYTINNK